MTVPPHPPPTSSLSSMLNVTTIKAFTSVVLQLSASLPSKDLGTGCSVSPGPRNSQAPQCSQSQPSAPPRDPHLCALTLVDEEDTGKGVREAGAVGSKEAASLVHVGAELEGLLLCGKSRMRLGEQATSQRALSG